ncbi:MAG: hypothetical protein ACTSPY_05850 [Candidatus Helarchaeota archaeon]
MTKKLKLIILVIGISVGVVSASIISIVFFNLMTGIPPSGEVAINRNGEIIIESNPDPEIETQLPEVPNITDTLENINEFVVENLTSYTGNNTIPDFGLLTHVKITLDWIYIIDDHDPFDSGEIYLQTYAMIYSTGNYVCTHKIQRIDISSMNSGENYTTNIVIFDEWVWNSSIIFEILDDDSPEQDDHLGYFWWLKDNSNWSYTGYLVKKDTTQGDAIVRIYQEVLGQRISTASDVVKLMRPYLYTDVDTSFGINFEYVYGRVVKGFDQLIGKEVYCIQYFFYWTEEYSIVEFVHHWDYEPFYMFIDPKTSDRPYRIVFDNGFYDSGNPNGDEQWWKCHEYTIYENLTMTGTSIGTYSYNVNFSSELTPLIGNSNIMEYKVKSINEIFDSLIERWVYGVGGIDVPVITIETCYHSFDKGDPNGGTRFDFGYIVGNLTDELIFLWFERLNDSFNGGTHSVGGQETPWYSPFCYDIMNPFQRPYISNNFNKLLSDIIAFNDAKNSKIFSFELIKDIKARLEIPIDATIVTNTVLNPNETFTPNITIQLDLEHAKLIIDYCLGFNISIDWWFLDDSFDYVKNGTIYIDFSNPIFQLIQTILDSSCGSQISFSPTGFIQVDMTLTPQLLGTIFNATIRFKIMELLYQYQPTLRPFISMFIADFDFVLNPVLEGFLSMDSWITNGNHTHYTFTDLIFNFNPTLSTPSDGSSLSIYIGNFSYGLRFYVDWSLEIDFSIILEIFFSDFSIDLMTFPDISATIISFGQDITLCTYVWNSFHKKYVII